MSSTLYRFLIPVVNGAARLIARVEISGVENVPQAGGLLIVSNHLANIDPLIVGMCFRRELHFMAKAELFRNPLLTRLITSLHTFPVRRGEPDRAALRHAEGLLREGRVVAVFPEGHRSVAGAVQDSKGGIALIARRGNAPILPVAITGTEHLTLSALRAWRPWRRPTVTISIGEPFALPRGEGRADYEALAAYIMGRVAAMLPPAYQGVHAENGGDIAVH